MRALPKPTKVTIKYLRSVTFRLAVFLLVAILMVLGLVMLLQARKNGGVWSLAGREVRVLPAEAGYSLIFLTLAVNVVAVAAAAVMGGNVGYYLIYVLVAWLFALLVYYTVKMM